MVPKYDDMNHEGMKIVSASHRYSCASQFGKSVLSAPGFKGGYVTTKRIMVNHDVMREKLRFIARDVPQVMGSV